MQLPPSFSTMTEWMIVGPMGPQLLASHHHLPVLAVDGGARYAGKASIWVGDADSHVEDIHAEHVFRFPASKDASDLALAMNLFSSSFRYKLHLWGFLGGRKDHELFNLGEISFFLESHPESQVYFYGEDGTVRFHFLGEGQWKFNHTGPFSLGTLRKTHITLTGDCDYPVERSQLLFPLSSHGLSNRGFGTMSLVTAGPVFVYFPEEK